MCGSERQVVRTPTLCALALELHWGLRMNATQPPSSLVRALSRAGCALSLFTAVAATGCVGEFDSGDYEGLGDDAEANESSDSAPDVSTLIGSTPLINVTANPVLESPDSFIYDRFNVLVRNDSSKAAYCKDLRLTVITAEDGDCGGITSSARTLVIDDLSLSGGEGVSFLGDDAIGKAELERFTQDHRATGGLGDLTYCAYNGVNADCGFDCGSFDGAVRKYGDVWTTRIAEGTEAQYECLANGQRTPPAITCDDLWVVNPATGVCMETPCETVENGRLVTVDHGSKRTVNIPNGTQEQTCNYGTWRPGSKRCNPGFINRGGVCSVPRNCGGTLHGRVTRTVRDCGPPGVGEVIRTYQCWDGSERLQSSRSTGRNCL